MGEGLAEKELRGGWYQLAVPLLLGGLGLSSIMDICFHRSVICLEDRSPVGRIEEVFGPVMMPLYALRCAGYCRSMMCHSVLQYAPRCMGCSVCEVSSVPFSAISGP